MSQAPDHSSPFDEPGVYVQVHLWGTGAAWTNNPEATWEALSEIELLITTMIEDLGGTLLSLPGDGYGIRFERAAAAVMWCARMQEGLLALDLPNLGTARGSDQMPTPPMASMGIHIGDQRVLQRLSAQTQAGQVLISDAAWQTIADPLPPDLQIRSLGDMNVAGQVMQVHQATTRLLSRRRFNEQHFQPSSLPQQRDSFIGRAAAMADLTERLQAGARLVNITGDKGIGKTRIAMQFIRNSAHEHPGGVALVSLQNVQDETELLLATAASLDMALGAELHQSIAERIGHAIASRGRSILLLDDFPPHISPNILETWVRTTTDTKILVTSDKPIESERSAHLHLGPMSQADSRMLFLARTHRVQRGQNRPSHASQVEVSEEVSSGIASVIEQAAGLGSPRWAENDQSILNLRRTALDSDATPTRRVRSALVLCPRLLHMGLGGLAHAVLAPLGDAAAHASLRNEWECAMADLMLHARDFDQLHRFMEQSEEVDRNHEQRSAWLLRKGRLALAEDRFSEAKLLLEEAANLGESPAIDHAQGQSLAAMDEWEEAVPWLEKACQNLVDPVQRTHALIDLGWVLQGLGRRKLSDQAFAEAASLGQDDPPIMALIHHHRFQDATARLELNEARQHVMRELEQRKRCGDQAGHVRAHIQSGLLDLVQHDPSSAGTHFHAALDLCRGSGLHTLEAQALTFHGIAARLSGDFGTALDAFVEAAALTENDHEMLAVIHSHRGAVEAACDAIENADAAFAVAETHLEASWDALANTIHDVLMGFVDLARARDAALVEDASSEAAHIDSALNRLARGSSFETRSTPPRGRETPSRLNELRLARLLLDGALSNLEPAK